MWLEPKISTFKRYKDHAKCVVDANLEDPVIVENGSNDFELT